MKVNIKKFTNVLVMLVVIAVAFNAGASLRRSQNFVLPTDNKDNLSASAIIKFTPECNPVQLEKSKAADTEDRQLFRNVYNLVKTHYVDYVTPEMETKMARGAVKGMVESFNDPENRFLDPIERKLLDDAGNGRFYGIGAILSLKSVKIDKPGITQPSKDANGKLDVVKIIIMSPMPGSPAEKAGLKAGDSITHINNKWIITTDPFLLANLDGLSKAVRNKELGLFEYQKTFDMVEKQLEEGLDIPKALEMLTAQSSGDITVKVERPGNKKPQEFKMQCSETYVNPVVYKPLDKKIDYLKISQFNSAASIMFNKEIARIKSSDSKGLIIDLRNNPGGLINVGAQIASKISGGGKLGTVIKINSRNPITMAKSPKFNKPIVVLINKGTASVAEMVAASWKSYNKATLVGTNTFGDGLAQTPLILKDGSTAVITTGRMLTTSGADFNGKGIAPDQIVRETNKSKDSQLEAAQRILLSKLSKPENPKVNTK